MEVIEEIILGPRELPRLISEQEVATQCLCSALGKCGRGQLMKPPWPETRETLIRCPPAPRLYLAGASRSSPEWHPRKITFSTVSFYCVADIINSSVQCQKFAW